MRRKKPLPPEICREAAGSRRGCPRRMNHRLLGYTAPAVVIHHNKPATRRKKEIFIMRIGTNELLIILVAVIADLWTQEPLPKLGKMFGKTINGFQEGHGGAGGVRIYLRRRLRRRPLRRRTRSNCIRTLKQKAEVVWKMTQHDADRPSERTRNQLIICAVVFGGSVVVSLAYDRLIDVLTAMGRLLPVRVHCPQENATGISGLHPGWRGHGAGGILPHLRLW